MIDLSTLFGRPEEETREELSFRVFPKTGTARWLLETRYRKPWHLKTWPRSNLRARFIYGTAWTMARFGLHLPSRVEGIGAAAGSPYAQLRAEFDHLGVFLGTAGPNRKIVVYAERPNRSVFVKIPQGPSSAALVSNERAALTELACDPELAALIPTHGLAGGHLAVENVEFGGVGYGDLDLHEVARIHTLLERRSRFLSALSKLRDDWEASSGAVENHCAETRACLAAARGAARRFLDGLPQSMTVSCYMAHGDFTPWNVLSDANGTARVIDWELFGPKPLYFDLLHYFVARDLLVKRKKAREVLLHLAQIEHKLSEPELWQLHVGLYFAYQALYYASVYERQKVLHVQAIWQLEAWAEILHRLCDQRVYVPQRVTGTKGS